ncbi:MAG: cytochrome c oxidase subunit 3 [Myxococcales bacterium]
MSAASQSVPVIPYRSRGARKDATAWIGMLIFLGSWAMMFAALFFAYGSLRARSSAWPPLETPRLPLVLPVCNTLVIGASSLALERALWSARRGRLVAVLPAILAALLLGATFVGLQVLLWTRLWNAGLRPDGGPYASVFYGLTVVHALHVAVGLLGLGYCAARASVAAFTPVRHVGLRLWAAYWHFVGVVWLLLLVTVFVL